MTGVRGGRPNWTNWFPIQSNILDGFSGTNEDVLMVDLGGGRGHDLDSFVSKFPEVKGRLILEDLPAVIDDAQNLNPRIEPVKHDFFKPQPIKGKIRCYLIVAILYPFTTHLPVKLTEENLSQKGPVSISCTMSFMTGPTTLQFRFSTTLRR